MECISCNAHNPDGTMYCIVCGADLPKSNPSLGMAKPKLAVFHVEETVLDNSAGERIAKRKGLSGKRFGREVAANLEKAVSRIGVKDYINRLARDNYTIAFISSLDSSYQYRLQDRLRHLGFPIMTDTTGPLVLMGSSQDNIRSLARRYDITFAFGTSPAGTAKQMNVPGVYATVEDYIGDSKNPYIAPTETPAPYTLSGLRPEPTPAPYTLANPHEAGHFTPLDWIERDNWDELQPAWAEKIDYGNTQHQIEKSGIKDMTIFEIEDALRMYEHDMKEYAEKMESERKKAQGKGAYAWEIYELYETTRKNISENIEALVSELRRRKGGHMANPPKPRRQKSKKTGKARRESAKKYFERLMGNKKMNKEFPDNSQRSAVALSYVEKEYGKRGVNSVTKSWGAMANAPLYFDEDEISYQAASNDFLMLLLASGESLDDKLEKALRRYGPLDNQFYRALRMAYYRQKIANERKVGVEKAHADAQIVEDALNYATTVHLKTGLGPLARRQQYIQTSFDEIQKRALNDAILMNPDHIIAPRVSTHNFRHVFYPAKMKRLRTDRPWVYPGQTLSGILFSYFQKAEGAPKGYEFEDLYFDYQMENRPNGETDVYVKDGSRYKKIGMMKTTLLGKGLSGKREHKGLSGKRPPMTNPDHFQPRPTSDSTPRTSWGAPTSKPSRQPSALRQIRTDPTRKYRFEPAKAKFRRQEAPYGYPRMDSHEQSKAHSSYAAAFNEARDRPPLLSADRLWFEDDDFGRNRMGGGTVDVYERVLHSAGQGRKIDPFKTLTKEEGFYRLIGKLVPVISFKDTPMTNPASPKKLKKAKDAYKKFHGGKNPDEVKTEKIDVGDVWYSLGECWTIGYMSPKENGNEFQKFIHEMNEESKDGNYPTLYATMPESGEPMLIIKGGSMKIGMRDGKAWLID